jgi:hypothetical protein
LLLFCCCLCSDLLLTLPSRLLDLLEPTQTQSALAVSQSNPFNCCNQTQQAHDLSLRSPNSISSFSSPLHCPSLTPIFITLLSYASQPAHSKTLLSPLVLDKAPCASVNRASHTFNLTAHGFTFLAVQSECYSCCLCLASFAIGCHSLNQSPHHTTHPQEPLLCHEARTKTALIDVD